MDQFVNAVEDSKVGKKRLLEIMQTFCEEVKSVDKLADEATNGDDFEQAAFFLGYRQGLSKMMKVILGEDDL